VTFTAATIVRGPRLRDAIGQTAVLQGNIAVAASTADIDCPGLAVEVDPYTNYIIEGYLAFQAGPGATDNPELRMGLSAPADVSGSWIVLSLVDNAGSATGNHINTRRNSFNVGSAVATEAGVGTGNGSIMAAPFVGWISTFRFYGSLQLRFAQLFSDAQPTTIVAGSWIRVAAI
jgi:hypothetical protein